MKIETLRCTAVFGGGDFFSMFIIQRISNIEPYANFAVNSQQTSKEEEGERNNRKGDGESNGKFTLAGRKRIDSVRLWEIFGCYTKNGPNVKEINIIELKQNKSTSNVPSANYMQSENIGRLQEVMKLFFLPIFVFQSRVVISHSFFVWVFICENTTNEDERKEEREKDTRHICVRENSPQDRANGNFIN